MAPGQLGAHPAVALASQEARQAFTMRTSTKFKEN